MRRFEISIVHSFPGEALGVVLDHMQLGIPFSKPFSGSWEQVNRRSWHSSHSCRECSTRKSSRWFFCCGVSIPVPPQRGQILSRDAKIAFLMNSDRFGIPFIASKRVASALKVMISCLVFFMVTALRKYCFTDSDLFANSLYYIVIPFLLRRITECQE